MNHLQPTLPDDNHPPDLPGLEKAVSKLGPELDESVFLTAKDAEDFADERKGKLILCDLCEKLSGLCGLDPDKRLAS